MKRWNILFLIRGTVYLFLWPEKSDLKWKLKNKHAFIYGVAFGGKKSRDFQINSRKGKMNECLLMADLSIKTNINKLVFVAHADPAVINAVINISQSEQNAWTFPSPFEYIYFYALLSVPFYAYSNTFDVIYDGVVHAI